MAFFSTLKDFFIRLSPYAYVCISVGFLLSILCLAFFIRSLFFRIKSNAAKKNSKKKKKKGEESSSSDAAASSSPSMPIPSNYYQIAKIHDTHRQSLLRIQKFILFLCFFEVTEQSILYAFLPNSTSLPYIAEDIPRLFTMWIDNLLFVGKYRAMRIESKKKKKKANFFF